MYTISLRRLAALFGLLAALYAGALLFGWFDAYQWYDIPMHLLGGALAGSLFFALFGSMFHDASIAHATERAKVLVIAISFGAFIGTLWEIFEFGMGYFFSWFLQPSIGDTMQDLFNDMVGAGIVGIYILFLRHRIAAKKNAS
jgi:hypothetical protein